MTNPRKHHPTHGRLLTYYKRTAKAKGRAWAISNDQFSELVNGNCHYCGIEPGVMGTKEKTGSYVANGIDRIDSNKGYVPHNVVSCCYTCNKAKMAMPAEDFYIWIKRLVGYQTASDKSHTTRA